MEITEDSAARGAGIQLDCSDESTVDLGAIPYGSKWEMKAGPYLEADINKDGKVDLSDISKVSHDGKADEYDIRSDLNHDGKVDSDDLSVMFEIYTRNGGALK